MKCFWFTFLILNTSPAPFCPYGTQSNSATFPSIVDICSISVSVAEQSKPSVHRSSKLAPYPSRQNGLVSPAAAAATTSSSSSSSGLPRYIPSHARSHVSVSSNRLLKIAFCSLQSHSWVSHGPTAFYLHSGMSFLIVGPKKMWNYIICRSRQL